MTNNRKWLEVTIKSILETNLSDKEKTGVLIEVAETYAAILEMERQ